MLNPAILGRQFTLLLVFDILFFQSCFITHDQRWGLEHTSDRPLNQKFHFSAQLLLYHSRLVYHPHYCRQGLGLWLHLLIHLAITCEQKSQIFELYCLRQRLTPDWLTMLNCCPPTNTNIHIFAIIDWAYSADSIFQGSTLIVIYFPGCLG